MNWLLLALTILLPQATMAQVAPLRVGGTPPAKMLNIAHRGARAFAPENTLEAFAKAADFGCPIFELDVHVTKDGKLIVVHDDTLTRCSNVRDVFPKRKSYFVSEFTLAEIQRLDAGSWYVAELKKPPRQRQSFLRSLTREEIKQHVSEADQKHYASGKVKHPTLRESLKLAKEKKLLVNVEIKALPRMYPGVAGKVVDLIKELKMERGVIVSSFDHEQMAAVRKASKIIPTAAVTSSRIYDPGRYVRQLLDGDAYNPGRSLMGLESVDGMISMAGIRSAKKAGIGINVWTVNDPREMRALIQAGVTGIFTDYPNRLQAILRQAKK